MKPLLLLLALAAAAPLYANLPPQVTAGGPFTIQRGGPGLKQAPFVAISDDIDPFSALLLYYGGPLGITFANSSWNQGVLVTDISAPLGTAPGTYSFDYSVRDSGGLWGYAIVDVIVTSPPNTPPQVVPTPFACSAGDPPASRLLARVSDAQDATSQLAVSLFDASPELSVTNLQCINGAVIADVEASAAAASGIYTVTVQVVDTGGLRTRADVAVSVDAPVKSAGKKSSHDDNGQGCVAREGDAAGLWMLAGLGCLLLCAARRRSRA